LAIVVGAAALVQPGLVAGEVAIIGKMVTDAAKKVTMSPADKKGVLKRYLLTFSFFWLGCS
jgi:hypothetical protein